MFRETLNRLDDRQFYLITGGLVLVVAAACVSLLVLPQWKSFHRAQTEQASLPPAPGDNAELQAMVNERHDRLAAQSRALHGDMAELPLREVEAYVIDRLQRIAWQNNVQLQGIQPRSGETIDSFRELLFNLELQGEYMDVFAWLQELRRELGFIVIKEYRMDRADQNDTVPLLRVQMTIASYRKEDA